MSKSKAKPAKKAAPKSGLIMKNNSTNTPSKFGSSGVNKNFSSSKKGGSMNNLPRKAS
ncbi:MAG: hypothetical protein INR73_21675 [Williamsia sp.]|nr:hypothetical protein [Williamsia sp.]